MEAGEAGGKAAELFRLKRQVLALAATADGELLAAAGDSDRDEDEPVIQLYRPLTDRKAGQLRGHTGLAVYGLDFSLDGKRLASAAATARSGCGTWRRCKSGRCSGPRRNPGPGAAASRCCGPSASPRTACPC